MCTIWDLIWCMGRTRNLWIWNLGVRKVTIGLTGAGKTASLSNSLRSCGRDRIYWRLCSLAGCNDRGVELGSWPAGVTSASSKGTDWSKWSDIATLGSWWLHVTWEDMPILLLTSCFWTSQTFLLPQSGVVFRYSFLFFFKIFLPQYWDNSSRVTKRKCWNFRQTQI
jgi:hypothetical protein